MHVFGPFWINLYGLFPENRMNDCMLSIVTHITIWSHRNNRVLICGHPECYAYSEKSGWEVFDTPDNFFVDSDTISVALDNYGIYFINSAEEDSLLDFRTGSFEKVEKMSIHKGKLF